MRVIQPQIDAARPLDSGTHLALRTRPERRSAGVEASLLRQVFTDNLVDGRIIETADPAISCVKLAGCARP